MTLSSAPGFDGTYAAGDVITAAVTFDVAVAVDTTGGTPSVALTIGSNTRNATHSSIDPRNRVVTFSYTVVSADSDQNGVSIAADALELNGGAIKVKGTTDDVSIDYDALADQSGHLVNKIPQIVAGGVSITSASFSGDTYRERRLSRSV